MYFGLSEEQLMIQDSFRRSLERSVTLDRIRTAAGSKTGCDTDLWNEMTGLGMPALLISESHGGAGLGLLEAAVVAEEIGRFSAPVPFTGTAVMATLALTLAGSDAQQSEWLPKMAGGELRVGVGTAAQAAGSRRGAGLSSRNERLTGDLPFVLDAAEADLFLVADAEGQLFMVEAQAEGLSLDLTPTIDGSRPLGRLTLKETPAEKLAYSSPKILARIINAGRIVLAAESLGAGEEMLRQAVAYSKDRKQFDRVIGSFQAVKHLCADMAAQLQPCQSLVWYAAYAFYALPDEADLSALLAKSRMDDVGRFVARTATEVHGGMGYTDLLGLHFWFKRIGFNRAQLGTPERLRLEAAKLQGLAP